MARQNLTVNQQAWNKEINRIKRFIRRAEKRGYIFNFEIPERPSRVTKKQLNLIKAITPNVLYSKADYIADYDTGEVIPGLEGRALERHQSALKAARTRRARRTGITAETGQGLSLASEERLCQIAINNIRDLIWKVFGDTRVTQRPDVYNGDKYAGKADVQYYLSEMDGILQRAIAERGEIAVGRAIINAPEDALVGLLEALPEYYYHSDYIKASHDFAAVLKGSPLSLVEQQNLEKDFQYVSGWSEPE